MACLLSQLQTNLLHKCAVYWIADCRAHEICLESYCWCARSVHNFICEPRLLLHGRRKLIYASTHAHPPSPCCWSPFSLQTSRAPLSAPDRLALLMLPPVPGAYASQLRFPHAFFTHTTTTRRFIDGAPCRGAPRSLSGTLLCSSKPTANVL